MILTKTALLSALESGDIVCDPAPQNIGPNSIDCSLGAVLWEVVPNEVGPKRPPFIDTLQEGASSFCPLETYEGHSGYFIRPGRVYLGHTAEAIGSDKYVPIMETRSTVARHGISVHHAGFGDVGFIGSWTFELVNHTSYDVFLPIGSRVAQVYFMVPHGYDSKNSYKGKYSGHQMPVPAKGIFDK